MNRTDQFQEIRDIADSICNEDVTQEQIKQLEELLTGNDEAQKFYSEYIGMHVHMMSPSEPTMEVVRRRIQVEEVIVRPAGSAEKNNAFTHVPPKEAPEETPEQTANNIKTIEGHDQLEGSNTVHLPFHNNTDEKTKSNRFKIISILIISLTIIVTLLFLLFKGTEKHLGEIVSGNLTIDGFGKIESNYLYTGEYIAGQATEIRLTSGDMLKLENQSSFKIFNHTEIELRQGSISIEEPQGNNIFIIGPTFVMQSVGSTLSVKLEGNVPTVTTGYQNILMPKRWRPQHYWSFDSNSDRAVDFAGNATGIPGKGVTKVNGLVGKGAFNFDNSKEALINVGSGGGTAPATGSFAVTDGVTIEALFVTQYSGEPILKAGRGDLDELFRKDQADNDHRMVLNFQNDKEKKHLMPKGDFAESLSFGLYIVGQGYHELKLPLDGQNGRPTLAQLKDNKAHHVVATYSVSTGLKGIYLDGKMLAHYQYPAGSKMLSGGSGMAHIGNTPNTLTQSDEAFSGIIDEVAFYNFALPDYMIRQHYHFFQQGRNYFGLKPNSAELPKKIHVQLPDQQTFILDPLTGLPESINPK